MDALNALLPEMSSAKFYKKPSSGRGHADHGWLKTFHHFPFASYYDPKAPYPEFGVLRVINEDFAIPGEGFGMHGHSEYEIFSYIIEGEVERRFSTSASSEAEIYLLYR